MHLPEPSVPAPVGTAPATGVREYMQETGQSCIFIKLPCLILQEPHLEQGSESTEYMQDAGQSCIFQNLPCLFLQEPHLEQGSETTFRGVDSLASPEPFEPAPPGTAPGTGVREYVQDSRQSCIFQNLPCLKQGSGSTCQMLDSFASYRTFRACSCRNCAWNRGQRVQAGCWTVLHLPEPSVPAPVGSAPEQRSESTEECWTGFEPGRDVKKYKQEARQLYIPHPLRVCSCGKVPEKGPESKCRRL